MKQCGKHTKRWQETYFFFLNPMYSTLPCTANLKRRFSVRRYDDGLILHRHNLWQTRAGREKKKESMQRNVAIIGMAMCLFKAPTYVYFIM